MTTRHQDKKGTNSISCPQRFIARSSDTPGPFYGAGLALRAMLLIFFMLYSIQPASSALTTEITAPDNIDSCDYRGSGNDGTVTLNITNAATMGSPATDIESSFTIPYGFEYIPGTGSIRIGQSAPNTMDPAIRGPILKWDLPSRLSPQVTARVSFKLEPSCSADGSDNSVVYKVDHRVDGIPQAAVFGESRSILVNKGVLKVIEVDADSGKSITDAQAGDIVNWIIVVQNVGTGPTAYVKVSDVLQDGLQMVSNDAGIPVPATPGGTFSWEYPSGIEEGKSKFIHMTAKVVSLTSTYDEVTATWGCNDSERKDGAPGVRTADRKDDPSTNLRSASGITAEIPASSDTPTEVHGDLPESSDTKTAADAAPMIFMDMGSTGGMALTNNLDSYELHSIGEPVTYTITVNLPKDNITDVDIRDYLPTGLIFDTAPGHTTVKLNNVVLSPTSFQMIGANTGELGTQLRWRFNSINNTAGSKLAIEFYAIVANIADNYASQEIPSNIVTLDWLDSSGNPHNTQSASGTVRITEPSLDITKSTDKPGSLSVGDSVEYTVTIQNSSVSNISKAYDLVITDTLPDYMAVDTSTAYHTEPSGVTFSLSADKRRLIWKAGFLDASSGPSSGKLIVKYTAIVQPGVTAGQILTNKANITWTSTPGANSNERTGDGGINDYHNETSVPLDVARSGSRIIKLPDATRRRAVGEPLNYTIDVTLPKATVKDVVIADQLPAGLIFDTASSHTTVKLGSQAIVPASFSIQGDNNGLAQTKLQWNLGTINNSENKTLKIEFYAIVANVAANDAGHVIEENNATLDWKDFSNNNVPQSYDTSGPVEIVEPDLTISKSANKSAQIPIGAPVEYTITTKNPSGSNTSTAYDLVITDSLPDYMAVDTNTTYHQEPSGVTFQLSSDKRTLTWKADSLNVSTGPGTGDIVVKFTAIVQPGITDGQILTNKANVTWTSTPGANLNERTGDGGINDYHNETTLDVSASESGIVKLPDTHMYHTIGESFKYTIEVTLPKAVANNVVIKDYLPTGLIFDTASGHTTTTLGTQDITPTSFSIQGANTGLTQTEIQWNFSSVDNSAGEKLKIEFYAIVANVAANDAGRVIQANRATLNWQDANHHDMPSSQDWSGRVTIIEPDLTISKSANKSAQIPIGAPVEYTITIQNPTGVSTATAYDLVIIDTLPDYMAVDTNTTYHKEPSGVSFQLSSDKRTLTWRTDSLAISSGPGTGELAVKFTAIIQPGITDGQILTNKANVTWTSTPGANLNERRGDGGINDYRNETTLDVSASESGIVKLPDTPMYHTIGESFKYTIEVTLPKAVAYNVVVSDYLPAGLIFDTASGHTTVKLGAQDMTPTSFDIQGANTGQAGTELQWDFSSIDNSAGEKLKIEFHAIVANIAANDAGRVIQANKATLNWQDANHQDMPSSQDWSGRVTIIEPDLTISKSANKSALTAAGEPIEYTIAIQNPSGPNATTACDLVITDALPDHMAVDTNTAYHQEPSGVTFELSPDKRTLTWKAHSLNMSTGSGTGNLVVRFTAIVQPGITDGQVLTNKANVTWTSTPGANPNERTGDGGINDYRKEATLDTVISKSGIVKLPDTHMYHAIGESLKYTIEVTLPKAVAYNVVVSDRLPAGLIFDTNSNHTTVKLGAHDLTPTSFSIQGDNTGLAQTMLQWNFSSINNSAGEKLLIEFHAIVANIAANDAGRVIQANKAVLTWQDVNHNDMPPSEDPSGDVTVVEPDLALYKSADNPGPLNAGDEQLYTLVINHTNLSQADAYDLVIADILPAGLTYVSGSQISPAGTVFASSQDSSTGQWKLAWRYSHLPNSSGPAGSDMLITYNATVDSGVIGCENLTNAASLTWTSTPGDNPNERNGSGGINDYRRDVLFTSTADTPAIMASKIDISPGANQSANLTFIISVENTGRVAISRLKVVYIMPYGMSYTAAGTSPAPDSVVAYPSGKTNITWEDLGMLMPGGIRNITLNAWINGNASGTLTDTVIAIGTSLCNEDVMDIISTDIEIKQPDIDVGIEKRVLARYGTPYPGASLRPGDILFEIKVINLGTVVLDPVQVTDLLPVGINYVANGTEPKPDGQKKNANGTTELLWNNVGPMSPGEVRILKVLGHLDECSEINLTNTASVTGYGNASSVSNITRISLSTIPGIKITKTASPVTASPGEDVSFEVKVTNTGDIRLENLVVTDTLPQGLSYISDDHGGSLAGGKVTWRLGALGIGQTVPIHIVARIDKNVSGELVNRVEVNGTDCKGRSVSDASSVAINSKMPKIGIEKRVLARYGMPYPGDPLRPGDILFEIKVINLGSVALNPVQVTDLLPVGINYAAEGTVPRPDSQRKNANGTTELLWNNIGPMSPAEVRILKVLGHLDECSDINLTNTASVTGYGNATPVINITGISISPMPDIKITKTASPVTASPGADINFEVEVTNTGDIRLENLVVTDTLPQGLSYISDDHGGSVSGEKVAWRLDALGIGQTVPVHIAAKINKNVSGELVNRVEVNGTDCKGRSVSDTSSAAINSKLPKIDVEKTVGLPEPSQYEQFCDTRTVLGSGRIDSAMSVKDRRLALQYNDAMAGDGDIELSAVQAMSEKADKLRRDVPALNQTNLSSMNFFESSKVDFQGDTPLAGSKSLRSDTLAGGTGSSIEESFEAEEIEKNQSTYFGSTTNATGVPVSGMDTSSRFRGTMEAAQGVHRTLNNDIRSHSRYSGEFELERQVKLHRGASGQKDAGCEGLDC